MKQVDWNNTQRNPMGGKRGKYESGKELFQKAREVQQSQEEQVRRLATMEPLLKKCLLDYMVGRKPIEVVRPFAYFTEEFQKGGDMGGKFREVAKTIPAGTKLTFERINKTLKQWVFKSQDGEEIEIYDAPVVMFGKGISKNPGWYGLLLHTNIFEEVSNALGTTDSSSEEA